MNSLMFPWYQNLGPDFELPHDDQIAIQVLYGKYDVVKVLKIKPDAEMDNLDFSFLTILPRDLKKMI